MTAYLNGKAVRAFFLDGEKFTKAALFFTVKTKSKMHPNTTGPSREVPANCVVHLWGPDYTLFGTPDSPAYIEVWDKQDKKDRGWGGWTGEGDYSAGARLCLYTADQIEPLINSDTKYSTSPYNVGGGN